MTAPSARNLITGPLRLSRRGAGVVPPEDPDVPSHLLLVERGRAVSVEANRQRDDRPQAARYQQGAPTPPPGCGRRLTAFGYSCRKDSRTR